MTKRQPSVQRLSISRSRHFTASEQAVLEKNSPIHPGRFVHNLKLQIPSKHYFNWAKHVNCLMVSFGQNSDWKAQHLANSSFKVAYELQNPKTLDLTSPAAPQPIILSSEQNTICNYMYTATRHLEQTPGVFTPLAKDSLCVQIQISSFQFLAPELLFVAKKTALEHFLLVVCSLPCNKNIRMFKIACPPCWAQANKVPGQMLHRHPRCLGKDCSAGPFWPVSKATHLLWPGWQLITYRPVNEKPNKYVPKLKTADFFCSTTFCDFRLYVAEVTSRFF